MKSIIFLLFFVIINCQAQTIMPPDDIHGPRTKWAVYPDISGGANRHSIIPQLSDLSVADFMKYLELTGANTATLNLENSLDLLTFPKYDLFTLTPVQINNNNYTSGQANILLTNFLIDVQNAIDSGLINGNIRFHVHMRLYLNKNVDRENLFINDFSSFINLAKARGVDHLIAGIKLGEHGTNGSKYLLQSALKIAQGINENTNGWLKSNGGLEWSGDGYGRDFSNINSWGDLSSTFFAEISKYTGYFTFCYKAFDNGGELTDAGLNKNSEADWETFIRVNLGFDQLKAMIKAAHAQYPLHANVIFIGDSGDAMKLIGTPEYNVTTRLYSEAGDGFRGVTAINGYRRYDKTTDDNYLYFWDALAANPPVLKPKSVARWQAWPINDNLINQYAAIFNMAGLGGLISPGGPTLILKGQDTTINIIPSTGFEIEDVTVNGVSQGAISSYRITSIQNDIRIQAKFRKLSGKVFSKPTSPVILGKWKNDNSDETIDFNTKYTVYRSLNGVSASSFYAIYWFDAHPDINAPAMGEIIELNDDLISKIIRLSFTDESSNHLKVDVPNGGVNYYSRITNSAVPHVSNRVIPFLHAENSYGIYRILDENISRIVIIDATGKVQYTSTKHLKTINLSGLSSGVYTAKASMEDRSIRIQKINIKAK